RRGHRRHLPPDRRGRGRGRGPRRRGGLRRATGSLHRGAGPSASRGLRGRPRPGGERMSSRPTILLSPDFEGRHFQLDRAYADAVAEAGGLPLVATYGAPAEKLLDLAEGVVITGGAFDIPPSAYGDELRPGCGPLKEERTRFEWALLQGALERGLPVLGVCGGMQLLNVVLGGTL